MRTLRLRPLLVLGLAAALDPSGGAAGALAAQEAASTPTRSPEDLVRHVLRTTPLFDGHNDLPWQIRGWQAAPGDAVAYDLRRRTSGHTDLERLREGRLGAQFWSVYVPCEAQGDEAVRVQLEQIALAREVVARYPDAFAMAEDASDVNRIFAGGRIASMLGMEGGHALNNSMDALRAFHDLGVRYITLTHNCHTDWADAATEEPRHGGLTDFGVELVGEMNRLGVLVDLSHTAPATMHDALDASEAPVIWSHAAARAVVDHVRNVPDDVLRRLPGNGGVVMVTFVPAFVGAAHSAWSAEETEVREELEARWGEDDPRVAAALGTWLRENPMPPATLADVADHIDHIRAVAGVDHVGIGGDFDGITRVVEGLEDVSTYPALFEELARRGWTETELRRLAGENVLRALGEAEAVARRLHGTRLPSRATVRQGGGAER